MPYTLTIRIYYPLKSGKIVLRSETDWDADVEADLVSEDGTVFEFRVTSAESYRYFKPGVIDANGFHWSVGSNYLGILNGGVKEIYPHFFTGKSSRISDPIEVPSAVLGGTRTIRIYHPPGYDENTLKRYPVLYMHDGSNLFFPDEAFLGRDWEVDDTFDILDSMSAIDKVIVVGVYSEDRMYEYTAPGYNEYGRFLVDELKPVVDTELRTLREPANTAVMGSSLGGVVSLYLAWQWPQVFGMSACMSSTFTYRDDLMARIGSEPKRPVQIYLDSGWPEDNYEVTRSMRDLLAKAGYHFGQDLLYFAFPRAEHDETHWATRSHIPFQFFFGKIPIFEQHN